MEMKEAPLYRLFNENNDTYPFIISAPHSGVYVPKHIKDTMKQDVILTNSDWFLPELFDFAENMGITMIAANISRYVVDLNRSLDKLLDFNYKKGVVYLQSTFNKDLYKELPIASQIDKRITDYYHPYHLKLKEMINQKIKIHSKVFLLDIHSFFQQLNEDVSLGNDDGKTSEIETIQLLKKGLELEGLSVKTNGIFKGGNTIKYYKSIYQEKFEGLILELNYRTYIEDRYFGEEEVKEYEAEKFQSIKKKLERVFEKYVEMIKETSYEKSTLN